jgi:hypothetical protein
MNVEYPGFGVVVIDGERFERDMVVDRGTTRPRQKGPSKSRRAEYGHTPLTTAEDLPWSGPQLIIGTGASGQLPVLPEVEAEAKARGIELVQLPTAAACELLRSMESDQVSAVLHVTC